MESDGRKIVMVLDNCPAHPHVELKNIELAFLPPNTTSATQPMDAGVIRNFKLHYRRILADRRLEAAETGDKDFKWNLLDCLFAVKCAWTLVTPTTIANCYRNAGFFQGDASSRAESSAEVASSQESELRVFRIIWDGLRDMIEEMPSLEDYVDIDNEAECAERMTDQEIVEAISKDQNPESDDDEEVGETLVEEPEPIPTAKQALQPIDCIRRFTLSMDESPETEDAIRLTTILEQTLMKEKASRTRQSTITDIFHPKDM